MISIDTAPGGEKPNEDWVGAGGDVIVVLDGLSTPEGVQGAHSTPWYVSRLGTCLLNRANDSAFSLQEALELAIADVTKLMAVPPGDQRTPSSTVALARKCPDLDLLEVLVLADSPIVVETTVGTEVVSDTRVDEVVPRERDAALTAPVGSHEKNHRVAELVRAQRAVRNVPGGYWIAQTEPSAAQHALTYAWKLSEVKRLALLTDGASRLVDTYRLLSWTQLLDLLSTTGPRGLISETRGAEASDPQGERWPRYKGSDDIAVAFWEAEHASVMPQDGSPP